MPTEITRRAFLVRTAGSCLLAPFGVRTALSGPAVRVGVTGFGPGSKDARTLGLTLGAEEATHASSLFGGSFELVPVGASDRGVIGMSAIIGDVHCTDALHLLPRAGSAGVPFVNVSCTADTLRNPHCRTNVFHVAPSDAMIRDAKQGAKGGGTVVAWHPSLVRFGADTLNRRFLERFGTPMTADAWTAWLATKIVWETALGAKTADGGAIGLALVRDSTQFDGHKGLPLSFRAWDHQLRQPLYVVNGTRVSEVPVAAQQGEPARELLDRLGVAAPGTVCGEHP